MAEIEKPYPPRRTFGIEARRTRRYYRENPPSAGETAGAKTRKTVTEPRKKAQLVLANGRLSDL